MLAERGTACRALALFSVGDDPGSRSYVAGQASRLRGGRHRPSIQVELPDSSQPG